MSNSFDEFLDSEPNILQMDVSMPFMGGMEATEMIRKYEISIGLPRTPIIALTAHASTSFLENIFLSPAYDYFPVIGDRERCLQAGMVSS